MPTLTVPQAFAMALQHHQAGRLGEAEGLYRQILAAEPNHGDALHLFGVLCHQAGRHKLAVDLIGRALAINPHLHAAHFNLGEVYRATQQFDAAVASYQRAIALLPDSAETYNNLGIALAAQGRADEASAAYGRALELKPGYAQAHYNLGNTLRDQGRLEQAVKAYREALRWKPDYALAHNNLGLLLKEQKRYDEAVVAYHRALELQPACAAFSNNLGTVLAAQKRFAEAEVAFRRALELEPDLLEAENNLGRAVAELGRFEEAIAHHRRVLERKPEFAEAHNNLGLALAGEGRFEEAKTAYHRALELKPEDPAALDNLGSALWGQGRYDEAEACYRRAIACPGGCEDAHLNLGHLLLLLGRYEEGWHEYEWRWRSDERPTHFHDGSPLPWDGRRAEGKTIFIHAEQGLGDTLHFVRYVPLALERSGAARIILECQAPLLSLLKQLEGSGLEVIARGESDEHLPAFDLHLPLLSLPMTLRRFAPESIGGSYLSADPELRGRWRSRLGASPGLRVGLAWRGNPGFKNDRKRSLAAEKLSPIFGVPGVHFVNLQISPREPFPSTFPIAQASDFTAEIKDFCDSAALIVELDLVICVDTSSAHLAGALGRPVWLMLPFAPDWRWGLECEDTPWYPTMRLFRQAAPDHWEDVVARVAAALSEWVAAQRQQSWPEK